MSQERLSGVNHIINWKENVSGTWMQKFNE